MLILSRKAKEEILVGEGNQEIRIRVIDIRRGRVRLGVEAPAELPIHRPEFAAATQEGQ